MAKEKIITVVIGLLVGVAVAGLYFAAVKFLPSFHFNPPKIVLNSTSNPQKNSAAPPAQISSKNLTVDQPADNDTVKNTPTTVSGKTQPGTKVIVFANADEKVASADAQGNFSANIKLEEGANTISVTSLADPTKPETIYRSVILEISQ